MENESAIPKFLRKKPVVLLSDINSTRWWKKGCFLAKDEEKLKKFIFEENKDRKVVVHLLENNNYVFVGGKAGKKEGRIKICLEKIVKKPKKEKKKPAIRNWRSYIDTKNKTNLEAVKKLPKQDDDDELEIIIVRADFVHRIKKGITVFKKNGKFYARIKKTVPSEIRA